MSSPDPDNPKPGSYSGISQKVEQLQSKHSSTPAEGYHWNPETVYNHTPRQTISAAKYKNVIHQLRK